MNSKEEAIKKAYGSLWDEVWQFIDDNGFCTQIDYNKTPSERRNHRTLSEMGFNENDGLLETGMCQKTGNNIWRPKSLQGIENNNGWIKIESEDDLPKTDGQYWVIREDGEVDIFSYDNDSGFCHDIFEDIKCTHYQPIQIPNPPIF